MKDERVYLLHAIDAILSYTADGRDAFLADGKTQDAVVRIHEYFGVDLLLVWDVVERELPGLRPRLEHLSAHIEVSGDKPT